MPQPGEEQLFIMNRTLKILHLEDLPGDAELAERELKKANIIFEKIVVDNQPAFIAALTEFKPDIVISDHSLPSFDSIQALKVLKDNGIKIPFILLTATVSEEFAVKVIKEGASDYILKDRMQRLPVAVLNAIDRNQLEIEQQKNLNKIIESEALMKEAERLAHFGSWEVNLDTGKAKCSEEACRILGYDPDKTPFSFENLLTKVHPDDLENIKNTISEALKTLVASLKIHFRISEKDGSAKHILTELVIKRCAKDIPARITGFCQDITEYKKTENELHNLTDELRNLAARLQDIREEERTDMAREIHDELGQQLTGLKMNMSWVLKNMNAHDETLKQKIKDSIALVGGTINTVRKIATELRPSILDDLGLVEALQWQSNEFEKRAGIGIEFNSSITTITLGKKIVTGIFRIFQESLTNIARHADATKVITTLQKIDDQLVLNIKDNGKGFDVLKMHHKKTLGLIGMKERTLMMGGKYVIMSQVGKGTSVLVSVPVNE